MPQEDDDFADRAQQLLDAVDQFLANGHILSELSANEVTALRKDRSDLQTALAGYRMYHGWSVRRRRVAPTVPTGSLQGMALPAVVLAAGGRAIGGELLVGGATLAGETAAGAAAMAIVAPIALAVIAEAALRHFGSKAISLRSVELLEETARNLLRDLSSLGLMTAAAIAITEETVKHLSLDDLLEALKNATRWVPKAIILGELLRRFPQCAQAIKEFMDIAKRINQAKQSGANLRPGFPVKQLNEKYFAAKDAMMKCIKG